MLVPQLFLPLYRLQLSVFAGDLNDAAFRELERWLKKNIDTKRYPGDKVLLLDLGPEQLRNIRWIGSKPEDWGLLTDPPDALFI